MAGRQRGDKTVEKIEMAGDVVCCFPFDATYIRRCWHGRSFFGEMDLVVRFPFPIVLVDVGWLNDGNDVHLVQEDPKDFFGDANNLFAPRSIWTWLVHRLDESWWLGRFRWAGIAEIAQDETGPLRQDLGSRPVGEICHCSVCPSALMCVLVDDNNKERGQVYACMVNLHNKLNTIPRVVNSLGPFFSSSKIMLTRAGNKVP